MICMKLSGVCSMNWNEPGTTVERPLTMVRAYSPAGMM